MSTAWIDDLRLMLRLVRREPVSSATAGRGFSPKRLAGFAASHGLSTVLLDALERTDRRELLPPEQRQLLEDRRQARTARTAVLLECLAELDDLFRANGQQFLLLKGPYLAVRLYGHAQAREYADLDLLIPGNDRTAVFAMLRSAGFRERSGVLISQALTCFFVHGFDFDRGSAKLDLHWRLSRHPSLRIDEAELWQQRQGFTLAGREYEVLGDEHELVFAVLSLLRDLERGSGKLKNVLDLTLLAIAVDAEIGWQSFFEHRRRERSYRASTALLDLCLELTDARPYAPHLAAALPERSLPGPLTSARPLQFAPAWQGSGNKLWSARAHDCSWPAWLAWWATSLPFRIATHRPRQRG
ncbi:MAG TPA: nucleotidyltransferase family protein [Terriglobales bacterium]|nr:nucleotidyltransferase family protein [Terriglobales bacterium]